MPSNPYAWVSTMRSRTRPGMVICWVDDRAGAWRALHSYRACRNFSKSSLARNRLSFVSGASSRARAFSFISRSNTCPHTGAMPDEVSSHGEVSDNP